MTGIILAGGKSSRMGEDKGLMMLSGKPMVSYVIDTVRSITNDIIIVTSSDKYIDNGCTIVKDLYEEKGPLAGIYTGLVNSKSHSNIVLSCDTPFVSAQLLNYLLKQQNGFDVIVAAHRGNSEQLVGIYTKDCLPIFKDQIESDQLKIKTAIKMLNYQEIEIDKDLDFYKPELFFNINTQEDFRMGESL